MTGSEDIRFKLKGKDNKWYMSINFASDPDRDSRNLTSTFKTEEGCETYYNKFKKYWRYKSKEYPGYESMSHKQKLESVVKVDRGTTDKVIDEYFEKLK